MKVSRAAAMTSFKRDWCWAGLGNESWDNWISYHLYLQEVGGSSSGLLPVKLDCAGVPTHLYRIQTTQSRGECPILFSIVVKRPREEESTDAKTTSCLLMHLLKSLLWELIDSNQRNLGAGNHSVIHSTGRDCTVRSTDVLVRNHRQIAYDDLTLIHPIRCEFCHSPEVRNTCDLKLISCVKRNVRKQ